MVRSTVLCFITYCELGAAPIIKRVSKRVIVKLASLHRDVDGPVEYTLYYGRHPTERAYCCTPCVNPPVSTVSQGWCYLEDHPPSMPYSGWCMTSTLLLLWSGAATTTGDNIRLYGIAGDAFFGHESVPRLVIFQLEFGASNRKWYDIVKKAKITGPIRSTYP